MQRRQGVPLPIFNRSKRPRIALFAHPNNVLSSQSEQTQPQQTPWQQTAAQTRNESYAPSPKTSRPAKMLGISNLQNCPPPPRHGFPTSSSSSSSYNQSPMYQPSATYQLPLQRPRVYTPPPPPPPPPAPLSHTLNTLQQGPSKPPSWGKPEADSPPSKPSRNRRPTQLLTATSQGVQHWSKYSSLTHLIFEVYGVVDSQVSEGSFGSKQFLLKTSDGLTKCCFWEIDRPLPRLVRGRTHRVVGTWDNRHDHLKCASVRQSRSQEDKWIRPAVEASDRTMRQLVATHSEL